MGKKIFLEGLVNLSALLSVQAVMNVSFCLRRSSDIFIALMLCWAFFCCFLFVVLLLFGFGWLVWGFICLVFKILSVPSTIVFRKPAMPY